VTSSSFFLLYFVWRERLCWLLFIFLRMDSISANAEVRLTVAQCFRTLSSSTVSEDIISALQILNSYLDDGAESAASSAQQAEFRRTHYTRTLQFLVSNTQADWLHGLSAPQRTQLWDGLFLKGPPEQALLVLMEAIRELRWVVLDSECHVSY